MKKIAVFVLGLATLGAIASPPQAYGQPRHGAGGRGYDPSTVETVSGEIVAVERVAAGRGRSGGVHVTLKTDRETLPVLLGPAGYLDKQKMHLERSDHVEVEGSRISFEGKPAIIAREVKKGGATLVLRNEAGIPAWAGRGGGRRRAGSGATQ
jgi:hypothetical protein